MNLFVHMTLLMKDLILKDRLFSPPAATVDTGTPVLYDMNPRTENTTKPANILVPQLTIGTKIESLLKKKHSLTY